MFPVCFGHFYRQSATSDGHTSWCRACDRIKSRESKRIARLSGKIKKVDPAKSREYTKKHRNKDLESARTRDRMYRAKRNENPSYRLISNVGRRIREVLNGVSGTTRHLPYSARELRNHVERQFCNGMSWDNYGSYWHLDHITPVSSFEINGPDSEGFIACWSLSNLRPLQAFENMSKGNKITHLI